MRNVQNSFWARSTNWRESLSGFTAGKSVTAKMETTMVDGNVLFSLELCALAVLVGVGVWRIYRTRQSAKINAAASVAHDMRQDRQRPSRPILDDACGRGDPALMFIL